MTNPALRPLQRQIHAACREMGVDSDTRRELQLIATGKPSMSDMDEGDLREVMKALKARGYKPRKPKRPMAPRGDVRFCHVLWRLLSEAGAVRQPGRDGLNAFIRARFSKSWGHTPIDIDAMREHQQIADVIDALKSWCEREGIELDQ